MNSIKRSILYLLVYEIINDDAQLHTTVSKIENFILQIESRQLKSFKLAIQIITFMTNFKFFFSQFRFFSDSSESHIREFILSMKNSRFSIFKDYIKYLDSFVNLYYFSELKK